jgi:outer membrane lipoprotein-sorting protein
MPPPSAALNVLIGFFVALLPVAQQPRAADDLFTRIFNRATAQQRTMQSVRARFTETTSSSLLLKPIVAHGTLIAATPARVRMTYSDPEPKTIVIDGKSLVVEWTLRGQRERIDIAEVQKRVDQYFTHADINQLRSMFQITAADAGLPQTDRIEMVPKRKQIKQGLERLELWIERERVVLVQMRMTFAGGEQKTITLEDIEVNPPVGVDTFQIGP